MNKRSKIRWQCRRGMRELDLLLERFLELGYDSCSTAEKENFERLLQCTNEDLHAWLIQGQSASDAGLNHIAGRVRATTGSRVH